MSEGSKLSAWLLAIPAGYLVAVSVFSGVGWVLRESPVSAYWGGAFALVLGLASMSGGFVANWIWPGRGFVVVGMILGVSLFSLHLLSNGRIEPLGRLADSLSVDSLSIDSLSIGSSIDTERSQNPGVIEAILHSITVKNLMHGAITTLSAILGAGFASRWSVSRVANKTAEPGR